MHKQLRSPGVFATTERWSIKWRLQKKVTLFAARQTSTMKMDHTLLHQWNSRARFTEGGGLFFIGEGKESSLSSFSRTLRNSSKMIATMWTLLVMNHRRQFDGQDMFAEGGREERTKKKGEGRRRGKPSAPVKQIAKTCNTHS